MGDARSKLDILYKDVLGEIQEVLNRMDSLNNSLQAGVNNTQGLLVDQAGAMLQASQNLTTSLNDVDRIAKEIVTFAANEREKIMDSQIDSQDKTVGIFMAKLKENTASFKSHLWLIIGLVGANLITTLIVILSAMKTHVS